MENVGNILALLIVAGSIIASVVTKNKEEQKKKDARKSAEAAESSHSPEPEAVHIPHSNPGEPFQEMKPAAHPDGTLYGQKNDQGYSGRQFQTRTQQSRKIRYNADGTPTPPEYTDMTAHSGYSDSGAACAAERLSAGIADAISKNPIPTGRDAVHPEIASKSATVSEADGFDLRKAVIWSEILKPKFEE